MEVLPVSSQFKQLNGKMADLNSIDISGFHVARLRQAGTWATRVLGFILGGTI